MKKEPRKFCVICEDEIHCGSRSSVKTNRGKRAITCSSKCSKIYGRVYHVIRERFLAERKKIEKEKNIK